MTMDTQGLDLSKVEHVIDDLDNTLCPYPDGFADSFSVETALSAQEMARDLFGTGVDDKQLLRLIETSPSELAEEAKRSYADSGFTTTYFNREFGLNEVALYQHHHRSIVEKRIKTEFQRYASHGLRQSLIVLNNTGVQQHVFTNGTEEYAKAKLDALGIKDCYNSVVGIDSFNDFDPPKVGKVILLQKAVPQAWHDFLTVSQIPSHVTKLTQAEVDDKQEQTYGYVLGKTERPKTLKDWDYSHCVFFDDSIENLKTAKRFGMQTVLVKTDRVTPTTKDMQDIDAVTDHDGLAVFKCMIAHEIGQIKDQKEARARQEIAKRKGEKADVVDVVKPALRLVHSG